MCRLVALIPEDGQITPPHVFIFGSLMVLSQRAGNDHGVGCVSHFGKSFSYYKKGEAASKVIFSDKWMEWVRGHESSALLGHDRLASKEFRPGNGVYESGHSHPFLVAEKNWLMHNGIFKDHAKIKKELGLEDSVTDTMAFVELLSQKVGNGNMLKPEHLEAALKDAGQAEYCLLAGNKEGDLYAVRGNRPLSWVKSNYGLLINTIDINLKDLPEMVNPGLVSFGYPLLELDKPQDFDKWSINYITGGDVTKVSDLSDLKSINDPVTAVVPAHNSSHNVNETNIDSPTARGLWAAMILRDHPALAEEELAWMLAEYTGHKLSQWWYFQPNDIKELAELLKQAGEDDPELADSDEKVNLWIEFMVANPEVHGIDEIYKAAQEKVEEFVIPYFLNTTGELRCLLDRSAS